MHFGDLQNVAQFTVYVEGQESEPCEGVATPLGDFADPVASQQIGIWWVSKRAFYRCHTRLRRSIDCRHKIVSVNRPS